MEPIWITLPTLLSVHLGFASLLGAQLNRLRQENTFADLSALAAGCLIFVAATLALPYPPAIQVLFWLLGLAAFAVFAFALREGPRQPNLPWIYAGGVMLLILVWSLGQGWPVPMLSLGIAAALAAGLAWRRAVQEQTN